MISVATPLLFAVDRLGPMYCHLLMSICICVCACICVFVLVCISMQCNPFLLCRSLVVLSSGSQWTHLLTSICVCVCLSRTVWGQVAHSGEREGHQVAAENGTKLAGDNKLVAGEKTAQSRSRSNRRNKIRRFGTTQSP